MKKSIFAASLLIAGVAIADSTTVETSYVIGVLPVAATNKTQMILSIPWVQEGTGGDLAVSNVVKTAGLTVGDTLTWYDTSTGKYQNWRLEANGSDVLEWKEVTTVGSNEESAIAPTTPSFKQGQAMVLTRTATPTNTVYIVGQVGTSATKTTTFAKGYTLVAPPRTAATDLNSSDDVTGWDSSCAGDMIYVVLSGDDKRDRLDTYTYANGKWGVVTYSNREWTHGETAVLPAGTGFYYMRASEGSLTVTWKSVPAMAE